MRLSELLGLVAGSQYPGPRPAFNEVQVLMAIEVIRDYEPIGRSRLARLVGLGGGSVKTLVDRLRLMGLVYTSQRGCMLTQAGRRVAQILKSLMPVKAELDPMPIFIGDKGFGILVKGAAERVRSGVEQRDAAIKVGALGATTVVCLDEGLLLPPSLRLADVYPDVEAVLKKTFSPLSGDVIVIGGADRHIAARYGATAAALTLIGDVTVPF